MIWESAVAQARALAAGQISPQELHDLAVARIEELDPRINSVVIPLFDRPATGVPMLLKDAGQELAGTPHWCGLASLRAAGAVSTVTTPLAAWFESHGFAIVGKAACPPLSGGTTTEPPGFEPTRNPWDPTMSVGGSSGGSAAAVAAGLVAIAHGSDATGSLRYPAALCGVATLNPTSGRVPGGPPPGGQPPSDVWRDFVLSRHAEDLAWLFTSLTGAVITESVGRLRVGVLDHDPELGLPVHPASAAGAQRAGAWLEARGHIVEEAWPDALNDMWGRAFAHFGVLADAMRPHSLRWVAERLGRELREGDVPAFHVEGAARAATRTDAEVAAAQAAVDAAFARLHEWWDRFDVLVTPTTYQPGWSLGLGSDARPQETGALVAPFSLSGQPALSLPLHWTDDDLPVGVQLVGARGADEVLLRLALDLQEATDWTRRRPPGF